MIGTALLIAGIAYAFYYVNSATDRARAQVALGIKRMTPAGYRDAVVRFNRAIAIDPSLAEAYLNRGFAERGLAQGDPAQLEPAAIDFERALELNPNLTAAHDELGEIYAARGDNRKALEHFAQSIHAKPTSNGYYQRGQLYEKLGEHEKALEDFNLAIAELTDAPYIYFARAMTRSNLGDAEGANADRARGTELATEIGTPAAGTFH